VIIAHALILALRKQSDDYNNPNLLTFRTLILVGFTNVSNKLTISNNHKTNACNLYYLYYSQTRLTSTISTIHKGVQPYCSAHKYADNNMTQTV
jgi:hypothetical protein